MWRYTRAYWRALHDADETAPLYRHLWSVHYRRSLWAASSEYPNSMTNMVLTLVLSPLFVLMPLVVSPIFGAYWAALVAGMIRYEYRQNRFELMGVMPGGALRAYRTITYLHIRRSRLFHYMDDALNITALIGGIITFLLFSGLLVGLANIGVSETDGLWAILVFMLNTATVFLTLYFDQLQSVVLGMVVGQATPLFTRSTLEARLWSASVYVGVQLVIYGVALTLAWQVVPRILQIEIFVSTIGMAVGAVALFVLRELVIRYLDQLLRDEIGRVPL